MTVSNLEWEPNHNLTSAPSQESLNGTTEEALYPIKKITGRSKMKELSPIYDSKVFQLVKKKDIAASWCRDHALSFEVHSCLGLSG